MDGQHTDVFLLLLPSSFFLLLTRFSIPSRWEEILAYRMRMPYAPPLHHLSLSPLYHTLGEPLYLSTMTAVVVDFTCVEPHPYGVLPGGNAYFQTTSASSRQTPFNEQIWQHVLSFCDGATLSRVVQTCRDWYVAGHQPELWRDLVLRQYGEKLDSFQGSWKDTYVLKRIGTLERPHVPMVVTGVYSEDYYRTHLCRSFPIPSSWQTVGGNVERISTKAGCDFLDRYEHQNQPVVLAGVARQWQATNKWKDMNYLNSVTQNRTFRATSGAAPLPCNFTTLAYHQYCQSTWIEEAPLYLFDRTALLDGPLKDDYYADLQTTCPFWDPAKPPHDLFQYLGDSGRPVSNIVRKCPSFFKMTGTQCLTHFFWLSPLISCVWCTYTLGSYVVNHGTETFRICLSRRSQCHPRVECHNCREKEMDLLSPRCDTSWYLSLEWR